MSNPQSILDSNLERRPSELVDDVVSTASERSRTHLKPIPFVRPALPDLADLADDIVGIFDSGMLTKGQFLEQFESELAVHLQVKHAVCVSSCTSGLMLVYRCANLRGEVIVPSFTFMATVSAMVWAGLTPVYADVKEDSTNLDPEAVQRLINSRTSAIVAVHNFGNPAEIDALQALADQHGLKLIFDSAHGFGARYRGAPVGSQGDAHVFSLSPTKLLVAGEGGVVATNDDQLAQQVRIGREYGNDGHYDSLFAGLNARMPELSALIGLRSLRHLNDVAQRRREQAARYQRELADLPGLQFIKVADDNLCSYKDFSIVVDEQEFGATRNELAAALGARHIDTRNYYDPPVHRHQAYQKFCDDRTHLPVTELLAKCSLSLPMGPQLDADGIAAVCNAIRDVHVRE